MLPRFFTAGPLPSLTFGAEVHGLSDFEWDRLQIAAASTMQPSAKMRYRTSLLILSQDPTWYPAVAPIVRYSNEIWANQTKLFPFVPPWAELRQAWSCIFGNPGPKTWRGVKGPLGAMKLALERISWTMPNYCTLVDDFGTEVSLTVTSPALLKKLLKAAVQRTHERASGAALLPRLPGARVCPMLLPLV